MRSISLVAVCFFAGVASGAYCQSKSTITSGETPGSKTQYFPKGTFLEHSVSGRDFDLRDEWYSSDLLALREPSLFNASKDKSVIAYRFLWLRTFHNPIAIRLTVRPDGSGTLTGKVTNGAGGYKPGGLTLNDSHEITPAHVTNFLILLQKAAFWSAYTQEISSGLDGAQWIMEGAENGRDHIMDRWSPEKSDYQCACLYLLELSKINVNPKEIY